MSIKNLLWVAVIGMTASCTVSKRIDKWGYRVSFDKPQKNEVITEEVAEIPFENKNFNTEKSVNSTIPKNVLDREQIKANMEFNPINLQVVNSGANNSTHNESGAEVPSNKKAERMMSKINSHEATIFHRDPTESWVYLLLILLVPFGTTIAMYLYEGSWTKRVTLNLLLTFFCIFPGFIHALVVIFGNK